MSRHRLLSCIKSSVPLLAGIAIGCVIMAVSAWGDDSEKAKYEAIGSGTRNLVRPGVTIKMLVEASNLGGAEVEVGELTLPADYGQGAPHRHAHVEIFYVLSGRLGHTVNGEKHVIEPGSIGIVRPGDTVAHSVESKEPVRAVVVWAPGGEADTLVKSGIFKSQPIESK